MITILCWIMAIGAMLAYASPIVAVLLMHYHEKRKHTCANRYEDDRYEEYCQREDEKYLERMDEAITKTDDQI